MSSAFPKRTNGPKQCRKTVGLEAEDLIHRMRAARGTDDRLARLYYIGIDELVIRNRATSVYDDQPFFRPLDCPL